MERAYFDYDAEQSVLGCALRDSKTLQLITELSPEMFTEPKHRLILQAIKELALAKEPVDLVTMDRKLSEANRIDLVGGTQYLITLMERVPSAVHIRSYIRILQECASRRKLKMIGEALIKASGDLENKVDTVRENAALAIKDVRAGETVNLISQEDAVIQTYTKISNDQRREDQDRDRIMTGITRLDNLIGGLYGSKLVYIGARPSVGKSIFALSICINAAKQGKKVLFISLEMEADEIIEREFAAHSLVPLSEITSDSVTDAGWVKLAESLGPMSEYLIQYCTEAFTVEQVRKAAIQMYENGGIDMICVDYIQLMSTAKGKNSRNEEVSEISRNLKRLAQELKIPIIALTQLNRASEKSFGGMKKKRAPSMSEARDSGSIEQDANIFILLHDPSVDELTTEEEKKVFYAIKKQGWTMIHVNVDKNRQGKKAVFYLAFDGEHMRFLPIVNDKPGGE